MGGLIDPVEEVLWCWNCSRVSAHVIDRRTKFYGGWVITTCKNCGEKQFISMFIHRSGRLVQRQLR